VSYARFGQQESSVYVYMHVDGWLECCWCDLLTEEDCFQAYSTAAMVAHLREHEAAGDTVPAGVTAELEADDAENFPSKP
jgi:hypothetical protein